MVTHPRRSMRSEIRSLFATLFPFVALFLVAIAPLLVIYFLRWLKPEEYGLIMGSKNDLEVTYREILFFCT